MNRAWGRQLGIVLAVICWMGLPLPAPASDFALPIGNKASTGDDLFTNKAIVRLQIQIPPEGLEILRKYRYRRGSNQMERVSVAATVREGGRLYTNVAVHLKGSLGSFRPIYSLRPALTLNFDKFAEGQRFH